MTVASGKAAARRQMVIDAAMELFLTVGFAETTMDRIAEASGVPRRTIFRDFPTKEDIVLAWTIATGPALIGKLDQARCRSDAVAAATSAVLSHLDAHRDHQPLSMEVSRLIEATPSLKARSHEKYLIWEDMLADAITGHGGAPVPAAMAAAIAISGLRIAVREWTRTEGGQSIIDLTKSAYAALARPVEGLKA